MTLADLQTLIGSLTSDPNHDRYTTTDIGTELDNSQDEWNADIGLIRDTVTITVVDGTRQYAISSLTGTPIGFLRVTHKGLRLDKRDKQWLDLYSGGSDWTIQIGTPKDYVIEITDPDTQYITLFPTPQANDAGAYLIVEYIKRHTAMSSSSDVPFMSGTTSNSLLRPYDWGLAYSASARLLARDPSEINVPKSVNYAAISRNVKDKVIEAFKALEKEEPRRMRGGRYWNSGYMRFLK